MIRSAVLFASPAVSSANGRSVTPVTEIGGVSLIERSLSAIDLVGIREVRVVVDGDALLSRRLRERLEGDHPALQISWLPARPGVLRQLAPASGAVLAVSSGVLFNPDMVVPLLDAEGREAPVLLVDRRLARTYDLAGALKLRTSGDRVVELGRALERFDAVSVGLAAWPAVAFESLATARSHDEALAALAAAGGLRAREVDGVRWHEVGCRESARHAEWLVRAYGADLRGEQQGVPTAPVGVAQRTLAYIEGLLAEKQPRHNVLMNPGPVLTSPRVKSALVHHDVCHRDEDYTRVLTRVRRKLRRVCGGAEHDVLLISGSGTAAVEAAVSSFIPASGKLLVVSNGAFGERFAEVATLHGIAIEHLYYPWGALVDPADVARALEGDASIFAVAMCHHETSVGLLNPVHEVGALCRAHDQLFIVDAVASLGGEELEVDRDAVDVLIASANKCLHAISGMSFVCVGQRVWPRVEQVAPRVYYLDLKRYRDNLIPFTPAVSTCFALDAALDELLQETVAHRIRRYRAVNERVRQALRSLGLKRFTETGHESHTVTVIEVPPYVGYAELYEALRSRGYIIYGCKEHLKDRYFQIANMGELSEEMVEGFLATFSGVLEEHARRARPQAVAAVP